MKTISRSFVVECFWPDVHEDDVRELDKRIRASVADGEDVRYLGSFLIHADEVVLCQFEGTAAAAHEVAKRAGVPFERLLETTSRFEERSIDDT